MLYMCKYGDEKPQRGGHFKSSLKHCRLVHWWSLGADVEPSLPLPCTHTWVHVCQDFSLGPLTNSQIMTWRLVLVLNAQSSLGSFLDSSFNLTSLSTSCLLPFCLSYFHGFSCLACPRHVPLFLPGSLLLHLLLLVPCSSLDSHIYSSFSLATDHSALY